MKKKQTNNTTTTTTKKHPLSFLKGEAHKPLASMAHPELFRNYFHYGFEWHKI